ncbi:hypothetical protein GOP47_0024374 [Adiantum capillus-veneris]|uniref:Secreted protein n=1 Tax=Adiantum capillus-veneris TaxID=13818 RepID=A0A9D4U3Z1_ADICA|nr:hypothetical protein GOP47_0024374 [Adiantum capillus-veneris]
MVASLLLVLQTHVAAQAQAQAGGQYCATVGPNLSDVCKDFLHRLLQSHQGLRPPIQHLLRRSAQLWSPPLGDLKRLGFCWI